MAVALPKFEVSGDVRLMAALRALGIRTLFSPSESNLTGISPEKPLFASAVNQKTWIPHNSLQEGGILYNGDDCMKRLKTK